MTRWRSSAGAWLRRTRSSRSLGTSRPSDPASRQIESLIADGLAAHSSSSSTATSMSLSRRAVPRARLPCSQARRTEESPPSACARRPLRLPTSSSPADTVMASLARTLCRSHAETGESRGQASPGRPAMAIGPPFGLALDNRGATRTGRRAPGRWTMPAGGATNSTISGHMLNPSVLRPTLALGAPGEEGGVVDLDGAFGRHPALAPVHRFYSVGEMLVIPAATTRYRARSRFDGQNMLETGSGIPFGARDGWLNRAIVNLNQGERRLGLPWGLPSPSCCRVGRPSPPGRTAPCPGRTRTFPNDCPSSTATIRCSRAPWPTCSPTDRRNVVESSKSRQSRPRICLPAQTVRGSPSWNRRVGTPISVRTGALPACSSNCRPASWRSGAGWGSTGGTRPSLWSRNSDAPPRRTAATGGRSRQLQGVPAPRFHGD